MDDGSVGVADAKRSIVQARPAATVIRAEINALLADGPVAPREVEPVGPRKCDVQTVGVGCRSVKDDAPALAGVGGLEQRALLDADVQDVRGLRVGGDVLDVSNVRRRREGPFRRARHLGEGGQVRPGSAQVGAEVEMSRLGAGIDASLGAGLAGSEAVDLVVIDAAAAFPGLAMVGAGVDPTIMGSGKQEATAGLFEQ